MLTVSPHPEYPSRLVVTVDTDTIRTHVALHGYLRHNCICYSTDGLNKEYEIYLHSFELELLFKLYRDPNATYHSGVISYVSNKD